MPRLLVPRPVIESRWVPKPLALAEELSPQRLNNYDDMRQERTALPNPAPTVKQQPLEGLSPDAAGIFHDQNRTQWLRFPYGSANFITHNALS
jgi:hypothetical protein